MKKIIFYWASLLLLAAAHAQTPFIITGTIFTAGNNTPAKDISIHAMLSNTKSSSNQAGVFSIAITTGTDTLVFSGRGYSLQLMAVSGSNSSPLIISMQQAFTQLEEVQLHTGYQSIPKERATGSFHKINNKLFSEQPTTNVLSRLEAISNSLYFDRRSGNTTNIVIRGLSTIQGPRSPLIILDNFPYEGNLGNINPNDIENITILKDAAAASIWGTKAGNGVIVITTKKAALGQPLRVSINNNIAITQKPDLFYYQNINASDFIDLEQFLYSKGFYNSQLSSAARPAISPVVELLAKKAAGSIDPARADAVINALRSVDARNDFNKYIYQAAISRQHSIALQAGSQNAAFHFAAGLDQNSSSLNEKYDRFTLRNDNSIKLTTKLTLSIGLAYTQTKTIAGRPSYNEVTTSNGRIPVYTQLADSNGNALPVIRTYRQAYLDTAGAGKLLGWNYYPLNDYKNINNTASLNEWAANLALAYKLTPHINAEIRYQQQSQLNSGRTHYNSESYFTRNLVNSFSLLTRSTGAVTYRIPKGDIIDISNDKLLATNIRGQISYAKQFNRHQLSAIAGSEGRQVKTSFNSFRAYGYSNDILTTGNVDYTTSYPNFITNSRSFIPSNNSFREKLNRTVSFYANAAYTYNRKYTISASGRRDASNLFGAATNNKWTPLWSAGFGWDITKESFYRFPALPVLKLRATYGVSGNADPARSAVTTISYSITSPYTQGATARIVQFNNPGLRWEKVKMFNLGLDFISKNARLQGSLEYYHKNANDLFGSAQVDYTAVAASNIVKNAAAIKGNGIDIALSSINLRGPFQWNTEFNLSFNKDKVKDYYLFSTQPLQFVGPGTNISARPGYPVYALYSFRFAGLDALTGNPMGYINGQLSQDYTALTGSSTKLSDLKYQGHALPTVFGSMGNTFSYKNLSLSIRLLYKFGYYFQRASINYGLLFSNRQGHADYALRWQKPRDENTTSVPSLIYPNSTARDNFYTNSEVLVQKADHIRLQYITLAYDIKRTDKLRLPFSVMQLYLNAGNLGLIWKANKYGIDPDYNGSIPPAANITAGCKIDF